MTDTTRLGGVLQPAAWAALLLIAAGCTGTSGGTATPTSGTPAPAVRTSGSGASSPASSGPVSSTAAGTALDVRDFTLDPMTVTVAGPDAVLDVVNGGPTIHNVTIRDGAGKVLGATPDLREGETNRLAVSLPAGTYVLFCSLPGHESLGIKGTLTVSAP